MTDSAHLPGKNALVAHFGGAGEAHLAAQEGIFANFRGVTHEHEVVNFCAAPDAGFSDGRAIHTRVRLNLDIVFDHNGAGLKDLVPAAAGLTGEAETVSSDDDAVLQDDAVANGAEFAHDGVGMGEEIAANAYAAIQRDETVQHGVFTDVDVLIHETIGPDVRAVSDSRRGSNSRRWMNPGRVLGRLVEQRNGVRKRKISILRAQYRKGRG